MNNLADKKSEISVKVHGPYGCPQIELENAYYEYFIFFAGGIGITPMQSIAKSLLYERKMGRPLKRIIFCWTGREIDFINNIINVTSFNESLNFESE